jgi:hypothetical protein
MDAIFEELEKLPVEDQEKVHAKLDKLYEPNLTPEMQGNFKNMALELEHIRGTIEFGEDGDAMKKELEDLVIELRR